MLPNYTGVESIDVELGDHATYDDLLAEIGASYGDRLPEKCWNSKKNEFRKPISAIGSNGDIDERDTPLAGHEEINFLIPVSGG